MLERLLGKTERNVNPQKLILRYLASSSIEEANQGLPVNERVTNGIYENLLKEWGIVKYVGPDKQYPEILYLLSESIFNGISIDKSYLKRPLSLEVTLDAVREVFDNIRDGRVLRTATALVLSPEGDPNKVVVGDDYSVPRAKVGKFLGSLTLPECFSKLTENLETSILRVLQREVFSDLAAEKVPLLDKVRISHAPIGFVIVADVKVTCLRGTIPTDLTGELSSPTILNLGCSHVEDVLALREGKFIRAGLHETVAEYQRFLDSGSSFVPRVVTSRLNREITQLPAIGMAPSYLSALRFGR
jgi:hypothetical protein